MFVTGVTDHGTKLVFNDDLEDIFEVPVGENALADAYQSVSSTLVKFQSSDGMQRCGISGYLPEISMQMCGLSGNETDSELSAVLAQTFCKNMFLRKFMHGKLANIYFYDCFTTIQLSNGQYAQYRQWRKVGEDDLKNMLLTLFPWVEKELGKIKILDKVTTILIDTAPVVTNDVCSDYRCIALADGIFDFVNCKFVPSNTELFASCHIKIFSGEIMPIIQNIVKQCPDGLFKSYPDSEYNFEKQLIRNYPQISFWYNNFLCTNSNKNIALIRKKRQVFFKCLTNIQFNNLIYLSGEANAGKSTYIKFMETHFDETSYLNFDSHMLGRRQNMADFVGKHILADCDATCKPLSEASISKLKQFKGGDELFNSNSENGYNQSVGSVKGNIIIAGNGFFECEGKIDHSLIDALENLPFYNSGDGTNSSDTQVVEKLISLRALIFVDCLFEFNRFQSMNCIDITKKFSFEKKFPLITSYDKSPTQVDLADSFQDCVKQCLEISQTDKLSYREILNVYDNFLILYYPEGTKPEVDNEYALGKKLCKLGYKQNLKRRACKDGTKTTQRYLVGYKIRDDWNKQ